MILSMLKRTAITVILGLSLLLGVAGVGGWYTLMRQPPATIYPTPVEQFKYGSIGTEATVGIPYWIWVVLPRLFPDKLPGTGGYTSLGLLWEQGKEMPVGLTKETVGIARVGMNCALCHVGSLRQAVDDVPQLLIGAPTSRFDLHAYQHFLFACAKDPRFTPNVILPEIRYNHKLSFPERWFYRYLIIPRTKAMLLRQAKASGWLHDQTQAGPGRTDMNALKIGVLGLAEDGSIGPTDSMAIWRAEGTDPHAFHSDGISTELQDVVFSSALSTGASTASLPIDRLQDLALWLGQLPPAPYPFPIDSALASSGEQVFAANCARCHAAGTARQEQVIPLAEIQTDPNRKRQWTAAASQAMNDLGRNKSWFSGSFRDTDGYLATSLAGIWARAPYLHNGSVPNLAALLESPDQRPHAFYRGLDVYDPDHLGFIAKGSAAEQAGFLFHTDQTGNSAAGHDFGTGLPASQKRALLEYLKTQ